MRLKHQKMIIGILLVGSLLLNFSTVQAQEENDPDLPDYQETYEGLPLCSPGIQKLKSISYILRLN